MTILRAIDFEGFLKNKTAQMNGLLLHGSDAEAVSVLVRQATRVIAANAAVQGSLLQIDTSELKSTPSLVSDEFHSLSLLGERPIILLDGVDDNSLKFVNDVLSARTIGNFVVLVGGNLSKSSKLRVACEDAILIASLAVYDEDESSQKARVRSMLRENGLTWSPDAEEFFFERVGSARSSVNQELDKLMLYCLGHGEISVSDVIAICGDTASFAADDVIDAVLAGSLGAVDRLALGFEGEQRTILIMLLNYVSRLQTMRADMDNGASSDVVVRNAKPPIFFKRQAAVKLQLRNLDLQALTTLQEAVSTAILQSRKFPDLANAITSRSLLSVARSVATRL